MLLRPTDGGMLLDGPGGRAGNGGNGSEHRTRGQGPRAGSDVRRNRPSWGALGDLRPSVKSLVARTCLARRSYALRRW